MKDNLENELMAVQSFVDCADGEGQQVMLDKAIDEHNYQTDAEIKHRKIHDLRNALDSAQKALKLTHDNVTIRFIKNLVSDLKQRKIERASKDLERLRNVSVQHDETSKNLSRLDLSQKNISFLKRLGSDLKGFRHNVYTKGITPRDEKKTLNEFLQMIKTQIEKDKQAESYDSEV